MDIVLSTIFGSQLYGTNTPTSDTDYKGIYIPSAEDILLSRIKTSISHKREKVEFEKNTSEDVDEEIYSLDKFLQLISQGQTVALDVLFSPQKYHLEESWVWREIAANRKKLLTKTSKAFIGYCRQQANKYGIKGSRVAAARDTRAFLIGLTQVSSMGKKLGEFANLIEKFANGKEFIEIIDVPLANGQLIRHLSVCDRKLPYTSSLGNAYDIVDKLVEEYGQRALQAEKNEGIDWKALSHAVRIGEQAIELFQTHYVVFPRPNADKLLSIKKGERPYKEVSEYIEYLFEQIEIESEKSTLPEEVDKKWIDNYICDVYGNEVVDYIINKDSSIIAL